MARMTSIYTSITDLVGNTPLLELTKYTAARNLKARIVGKVEYFNPAGSIKDRAAWAIIRSAEVSGELRPGGQIVDITSGNTGIALAAVAARRGYRAKFYHSDNISPDKITLLKAYGAELVSIPNTELTDPTALLAIVENIVKDNPDAFFANQLANPANPLTHYETTGPEIWRDTDGQVDVLVGGVGTGGTISGAGRFLREHNPDVRIIVAEPGLGSLPTPDHPYPAEIDGVHKVTELDTQFLPPNYNTEIADEVIAVETAQAREVAQALAREEGLVIGTSSAAIVWVATQLAKRPEYEGKLIAAILPDSGERYLSAGTFG